MKAKSNIIHASFAIANDNKSGRKPSVRMTKTKKVGNFRVYTNLSKLSHQEFFIEMFRDAVSREKETAMINQLSS